LKKKIKNDILNGKYLRFNKKNVYDGKYEEWYDNGNKNIKIIIKMGNILVILKMEIKKLNVYIKMILKLKL
jgi:hypothetical protein